VGLVNNTMVIYLQKIFKEAEKTNRLLEELVRIRREELEQQTPVHVVVNGTN
jgi:hypothetical protein